MADRWTPRVTVAAVARRVVDGRCEWLLVEEATAEGLRLNNPAGHLEPGESLIEAVVREALEETACAFVPERLLGVYLMRRPPQDDGVDTTWLRFAFAGTVGDPDPTRRLDTPVLRTLWLGLDAIRASADRHRSPLLLRCVEDDAAGRAFGLDALVTDASVTAPR